MERFKPIEGIVIVLKDIVDHNGLGYIADNPFLTYKQLLKSKKVDKRTAIALLSVFVSGVVPFNDDKHLSSLIKTECSLNETMADRISSIFCTLYSEENRKEWSHREGEGLAQFLEEEFSFDWKGYAVWDAGNGTVDCHYEAHIILKPTEAIVDDKELSSLLSSNPFAMKEEIHELFSKRLLKYLNNDFNEYCTCDDYYQPVVEDYDSNLESNLEDWGKSNGFEFVSCDGDGFDDGYEPKFRRGMW